MIIIFPLNARPYALEVNDSFSRVFETAREMVTFDADDLSAFLVQEYALDVEEAREEALATIDLWRTLGLLMN